MRLLTLSVAAALALAGCGAPQDPASTPSGSTTPAAQTSESPSSASASTTDSPSASASAPTSESSETSTAAGSAIEDGTADAAWIAQAKKVMISNQGSGGPSPAVCMEELLDQRTLDGVATLMPDGPSIVQLSVAPVRDDVTIMCIFGGPKATVHVNLAQGKEKQYQCAGLAKGGSGGTLVDDSDGIYTYLKDKENKGPGTPVRTTAGVCSEDEKQYIYTMAVAAPGLTAADTRERTLIEEGVLARDITAHRRDTLDSWLKAWQAYAS